MKKNMGKTDRFLRVIMAIGLICLLSMNGLLRGWATTAWIVVFVFAASSMMGVCPLYSLLGWSTLKKYYR